MDFASYSVIGPIVPYPEAIDDCNLCRQIYFHEQTGGHYYAPMQAFSVPPSIVPLYSVTPAWSSGNNMGIYYQDPVLPDLPSCSRDDLGTYSADGCWYPNSSPIKPKGSIPFRSRIPFGVFFCGPNEEVLPLTAKELSRKTLKAKLVSQDEIEKIYAKFHTPSLPSTRPILLGLNKSIYSPGLGFVWKNQFSCLTASAFPEDAWSIVPHNPSKDNVSNWTKFIDMAKVRFCCKTCKHGWTSMHGSVVFFYIYEELAKKGMVSFMLTGQNCIACKSHDFETPMWYPEEAQKVLTNLYHEIASKVYNKATPPLIKDRRHGRPRQQHIATNCQGCLLGVCKIKLENYNKKIA